MLCVAQVAISCAARELAMPSLPIALYCNVIIHRVLQCGISQNCNAVPSLPIAQYCNVIIALYNVQYCNPRNHSFVQYCNAMPFMPIVLYSAISLIGCVMHMFNSK